MNDRTFVLDVSSFMYRAYHASKDRPYYNKAGEPIYAIHTFRTMMERLRRDHKPDFMVAACDPGRPSFRVQLYPQYKADRLTPPEEFLKQKPGMLAVLDEYCVPQFQVDGYEADDIIGTLAEQITGCDVYICSADKDMCQLVRPGVYVLNPAKGVLDASRVEQEMGVKPAQVTDLLALLGDSTDNVPGCPGIGDKGAVQLVRQFGSVEKAIAQSGCIAHAAYRRAVQRNIEQILLCKKLVTICRDVVLPPGLLV